MGFLFPEALSGNRQNRYVEIKIKSPWGLLANIAMDEERDDDGRRAVRHHGAAASPFVGYGWRMAIKGKGTSFAHVRTWKTRPRLFFARSSADRAFAAWVARRTPSRAAR